MAQPTDNIKVLDAEPQAPAGAGSGSDNQGINPNVLLNNTLDGFANLSSKFNPFAQRLGKGIGQVRQYAQERLGTAEDITELPDEYKELEKRVDALRSVYVNLLKVSRTFNNPSYDYPVQLQESLAGIGNTFTTQFQNLALSPAERAQAEQQHTQGVEKQHPKTLSHALSRVAATGAQTVGVEDALGTALFKVATVSEKVGDARVNMDQAIVTKFNQPMLTTLNTAIEQALKARRNVQSVRLGLDACKGRYRAARPERQDAARLEVEQAEDQFVAAVEEATSLMKAALENPEPFRNLADLIAAQAAFYKEAHELLTELAPELDEIQVTQESLHRNRQE
ncbi:Bin/amphiphysin/Rvs domain for vesicular trafficking-domain-containing protein [Zychaea mexicana]|uniref:Bin/amphiphysin/Rvs domain for vesicular trafficking-domain-containing protein n=1 Tax=Zychaea mexicana TaxID=64656 RepID=UPI0022FDCDAC|nr:Bin/amphiphysin/Rvs domain for vesicular trafficking-domain-containing protein [Zychaea mexicana]KAI9499415.1 Bin/amphiphysin/Rvs domain for vesicular trafficking-domain-containing protein [Zychaea mexicana]